jgi:hypothetical protein
VRTRVPTGTSMRVEGGSGGEDSVDNLFFVKGSKRRHIFTQIS